jgi:hypothetical protein
MKIPFLQSDKQNWSKLQIELSDAIMKYLAGSKDFFIQFGYCKPEKDSKFPNTFFFRQSNKENLTEIRASVGKELTKRISEPNFDDFKLMLVPASAPSDNQRGYYWGVVLPTIQEHFKKEGNFIAQQDLHEAIKDAIEDQEGLKTEKVNPITGEIYQAKITISNAGNKADVARYIDAVIRFAAGYGIEIPSAPEKY